MSIRKLKNRSGSLSVQVIQKLEGHYKFVKTIGSATGQQEAEKLVNLARQEIEMLSAQPRLFISESDAPIEQAFSLLNIANIRKLGLEIILGRIYDHIGFSSINEELFRYLVIARLVFPLSKLKTIDKLNDTLKP